MTPMFRTCSISTARACIFSAKLISLSVPEVGESLVAFSHPMGFFLPLDGPARVLGRVEQLERELLRHALPAPLPRETDDPAAGESPPGLPPRLHRGLGGGAPPAGPRCPPHPGGVSPPRPPHPRRPLFSLPSLAREL